jgi:hypothetical protein
VAWLLLTFTVSTKRASQRVEVWRKLQRYGTVPLGNSGYLLPANAANEERFRGWQRPFVNMGRCFHCSREVDRQYLDSSIGRPLC